MAHRFLVFAALNGFLSVAFGAFAAHGLENRVSENFLDVFNTAAEYQMTHSLVLLLVSILMLQVSSRTLAVSAWAFSLGLIVFSGSLYLLVLLDVPALGVLTPVGGVAFLTGWACLIIFAVMRKDHANQA